MCLDIIPTDRPIDMLSAKSTVQDSIVIVFPHESLPSGAEEIVARGDACKLSHPSPGGEKAAFPRIYRGPGGQQKRPGDNPHLALRS